MDDLLRQYYERELGLLRQSIRAFATRNPKIAARLAISGEHSDDPHTERLLQSGALLAAHIDLKLENEYPEFTEPLLEVLYPQYLRPVPACSIAFFHADTVFDTLTQPVTIGKGTQLLAKTGECRFQTIYDVTLSPLRITKALYALPTSVPAGVSLPGDTAGILSITFASNSDTPLRNIPAPRTVRIHLCGQQEVVASLVDILFMDVSAAFVEADNGGRWQPFSHIPVSAVGLDQDPLIEDGTSPAFSLLMEYLIFPDKFNFIDIEFAGIARKAEPVKQLTLHLAVRNVRGPDSLPVLNQISEKHFKLHCTPVINLFKQKAVPIKMDGRITPYPVFPKTKNQSAVEIYSINEVRAAGGGLNEALISPYYALTHSSTPHLDTPHWIMDRGESDFDQDANYETRLSITGSDGTPVAPNTDQLALELTCTNGDLPSAMPFGSPGGDLTNEKGSLPCKISLLSLPTERVRLPRRNGALWRLIEFLTPHPLQVSNGGLDELKRLFRQYATGSFASTRYLDGLTALSQRASLRWIPMKPSPLFVRGIEIVLTVDEQVFVANSLSTFIAVMDRFFARYAPDNSFVQLVVVSQNTAKEIQRCLLRQGTIASL